MLVLIHTFIILKSSSHGTMLNKTWNTSIGQCLYFLISYFILIYTIFQVRQIFSIQLMTSHLASDCMMTFIRSIGCVISLAIGRGTGISWRNGTRATLTSWRALTMPGPVGSAFFLWDVPQVNLCHWLSVQFLKDPQFKMYFLTSAAFLNAVFSMFSFNNYLYI